MINEQDEPRSKEQRIERLEIAQEEAERDKSFIDITIQKLNELNDSLPYHSTAREQISRSIKALEQEQEIAEQIEQELEQEIEQIK